jgi:hypothetical protein
MIRRDYILKMLAEFFEVLSRIQSLRRGQNWEEAGKLTDFELQQLVGEDASKAVQLSETELLALLIKGEPTQSVREKTLMLATLLKEAGDNASGQKCGAESCSYYLKGLHLLLGVLAREEVADCPAFVPRVEGFLSALADCLLPLGTQAMLMQHYERLGDFGRAEDMLFSMVEEQPRNVELLHFGVAFYERLQRLTDDALISGNLPRGELNVGLAQIVEQEQAELARAPLV